jgi:hypothetical protein
MVTYAILRGTAASYIEAKTVAQKQQPIADVVFCEKNSHETYVVTTTTTNPAFLAAERWDFIGRVGTIFCFNRPLEYTKNLLLGTLRDNGHTSRQLAESESGKRKNFAAIA